MAETLLCSGQMAMASGAGSYAGSDPPSPTALSQKGSSYTTPLDLGVIRTGYLDKTTRAKRDTKRRFVVLTRTHLHWYQRDEGDDLFGEEKGSVPLSEVKGAEPMEESSFEVSAKDRKRVFTADGPARRDIWVRAINQAMAGAARVKRATITELSYFPWEEAPAPQVSMVTLRSETGRELVLASPVAYGQATLLQGMDLRDFVMIRLENGAHATVDGDVIKSRRGGQPFTVTTSTNLARLTLRVEACEGSKAQSEWYRTPEASKYVALACIALYTMNLMSCLMLAYAVWSLHGVYKRSHAVIAPANLYVSDYQTVRDADLARAAGDSAVPRKFIEGCPNDLIEARRRWRITKAWRDEFGIDTILEGPHPHFELIKQHWPHYFLYFARNGDPVYIERSGELDVPTLLTHGVTVEDLLFHCVHATEYLYKKLFKNADTQKLIHIFDLSTANLADLKGEARVFLRRVLGLLQQHYLERSKVIIVANAPGWFSFLWTIIKPLLHPRTVEKIRIAASGAETFRAMAEFIEPQYIPAEYGGELRYGDDLKNGCRWNSPQEVEYLAFVRAANARFPNGPTRPLRVT
jgi:hypothetical protein